MRTVLALILMTSLALVSFACVVLADGQTEEKSKKEEPQKALGRYLESQTWALTKVDAENSTVSARLYRFAEVDLFIEDEGIESPFTLPIGLFNLEGFPVRKGAKIVIDGKAASIKDLKPRMRVSVRLAADDGHIAQLDATSPEQAVLKATDVVRNTVTITRGGKELLLTPAANAKYLFKGGREGEFTDLKPGMPVDLQLGCQDGKLLITIIKAGK
jgi:hypothetical protein